VLGRGVSGGRPSSFLLRRCTYSGLLLVLLARASILSVPIGFSDRFIEEGAQLLGGLEPHVADDDVAVGQENTAPTLVPGMVDQIYEPIELEHEREVGRRLEAHAQLAVLHCAGAPLDVTVHGFALRSGRDHALSHGCGA
jgi:hypothetical protein